MSFNSSIYAVLLYKAYEKVPQVLIPILENNKEYRTHFTWVAAAGKVKSYSRIEALTSAFGRRV